MKREYTYLLEILLGLAVILFINVMWFPADMGFIGVPLSPYWIVVLFVAARYGSFPGFVAGLASSAALLISVSYNTAIEQQAEFAAIPLRQIQLSAFFILIGFLLGEERSRVNLKRSPAEHAEYLRAVNLEHRHIYDAILRRDPGGARGAMRSHLTNSLERLRSTIEFESASLPEGTPS